VIFFPFFGIDEIEFIENIDKAASDDAESIFLNYKFRTNGVTLLHDFVASKIYLLMSVCFFSSLFFFFIFFPQ